jgi:hypothetical protein
MFEQILELVKEKVGTQQIPADQQQQVHEEIAGHINHGLKEQAAQKGGVGDLLSSLSGSLSNSPMTGAISGSIVSSLGSKFGLFDPGNNWCDIRSHTGYLRKVCTQGKRS